MKPNGGATNAETVLVAGAGLGGALMAIYLARAGYRVEIHERRSDPRRRDVGAGRSINLAISTRGLAALREVGLEKKILEMAVPMRGRMMHDIDGKLRFQPYDKSGQAINSVSRLGLNIALIDEAERHPNVRVEFDSRCVDVDLDRPALIVENEVSGQRREVTGDRVIGADGAFSAIRARMQKLDRFDYSQSYLEHGYKELTIPPGEGGEFRIEPNALHIWPRRSLMMIGLPNADGSFTCTLFWPFDGPNSFSRIDDGDALRRLFQAEFPDAIPLMPALHEEYFGNPTSSLVTVRCRPWYHGARVALLGDACHAVVPFYGQGANAAFEDCIVLNQCILEHAPDWGTALAEYDRIRKHHVDVLADLAIQNFIEMRDHVASGSFRTKKKIEQWLHHLFPKRFVPLYSMVSFSRVPYGDAVERARRQWSITRNIAGAVVAALLIAVGVTLGMIWK